MEGDPVYQVIQMRPHDNVKGMELSQLFVKTEGQGRPLVLLHGWGMNQQVWQPVRAALSARAHVTLIDLPGHGQSSGLALGRLDQVLEQLVPHIPAGAVIMGWSLGGLIAQALARTLKSHVAGLIMVGSTPRFVMGDGWEHGLPVAVLDGFADSLQQDYAATVRRFFALQFMGVRSDPVAVNRLRDDVLRYPADLQALADGLDLLRHSDFRQPALSQPCLWLLGKLDKLIPVSVAEGLHEMGYPQVVVIPKAAHVPFVTHTGEFMQAVGAFLDEY